MTAYASLWKKGREQNVLYSALLELTYQCNLDCFFCYNDLSLHGRRMRFEDYKTLLDDLNDMQVMGLSLSGGEPLAYPKFFELGQYAKELGFAITVKSNGHMLNQRVSRRIANEIDPYLLETSLHGACADTHDRQTQVKGSFDRLMKNLVHMKAAGLRVRLNSTLTSWNENELEGMYEIADRHEMPLQIDTEVSPRDDGDQEPISISASDEGIKNVVRIGMERAKGQIPMQSIPVRMPEPAQQRPSVKTKNCGAGSTTVSVDPFGNVYPCVQWRDKIGNVHEHSIKQIWNESIELEQIRETSVKAHHVRQENQLAGFCPGFARLTTGSALSVYPEAKRKARLSRAVFEENTD